MLISMKLCEEKKYVKGIGIAENCYEGYTSRSRRRVIRKSRHEGEIG